MAEYTRKDIICFTDDLRLENAIGKKVYASDSPSSVLSLAMGDMLCHDTLAIIHKDYDKRPFTTYFEGPWFTGYNHYDVIIIKKEES